MKSYRLSIPLLCIAFSLLTQGCYSIGVYRTAEILPEGEGDFTMTFSAVRMSGGERNVYDEDGNATVVPEETMVLPNIVPEIGYHIGVSEDVEVGGRIVVTSALMELDFKYRFLGGSGEPFQMAVQPALGYRAFGAIQGISVNLPLISTFEVSKNLALNVAPFVSYTDFSATDSSSDLSSLGGSWVSAGASVGFKVQAKTMYFMPQIEVSKMVQNLEDASGSNDSTELLVMFGVTLGFNEGREMSKLEEMDKKIDKLMDK